jgi:hypothetical protein
MWCRQRACIPLLTRWLLTIWELRLYADVELADALLQEYYRFEPYLRHAVHNIVAIDNQHYVYDVDRGQR